MKKKFWTKRMPTTLAFVVLFISIWVTSFLIQKSVIFVGKAGPNKVPQKIVISNITDSSFTVNFTTEIETVAGLSVEGADEPFVVYDDRNKNKENPKAFFSHYITVSDLDPKTTYQFTILSGGETYLDNGKKYSVETGEKISSQPPNQKPLKGKILLPQGGYASDTIVKLEVNGGQIITALTKDDGEFIIPTNSIRRNSLNEYLNFNGEQIIKISAFRQNMEATLEVLSSANLIPTVTLEERYDFTNLEKEKIESITSQLKIPEQEISQGQIKITVPRTLESFIDSRPLFRGTALPNKIVKITIQSEILKAEVKSDLRGIWSYRPASPLAPGNHTITIETVDGFGITRTLSQTFTIFSSGSQIAESATPSATPVPTSTPTPTITPTPTLIILPTATLIPSPSASPTPTLSATVSPTLVPTIVTTPTPTPTIVVQLPTATSIPTPAPTIAPTGNGSSIVLTAISLVLIFAGGALLFLL